MKWRRNRRANREIPDDQARLVDVAASNALHRVRSPDAWLASLREVRGARFVMPSEHAMRMLQQGRLKRAWRSFLVAVARAEQPENDRYVVVFVICLGFFMVGYKLGKWHEQNYGRPAVETRQ